MRPNIIAKRYMAIPWCRRARSRRGCRSLSFNMMGKLFCYSALTLQCTVYGVIPLVAHTCRLFLRLFQLQHRTDKPGFSTGGSIFRREQKSGSSSFAFRPTSDLGVCGFDIQQSAGSLDHAGHEPIIDVFVQSSFCITLFAHRSRRDCVATVSDPDFDLRDYRGGSLDDAALSLSVLYRFLVGVSALSTRPFDKTLVSV
jgi:hypothetical protein